MNVVFICRFVSYWIIIMTQGYGFVKNPVEFVKSSQNHGINTDSTLVERSKKTVNTLNGEEARSFYENVLKTSCQDAARGSINKNKHIFSKKIQKQSKDVKPSSTALKSALVARQPCTIEFFKAAEKGNVAEVKKIFESRVVDINATDQFSWTALMMAANRGHEDVVKYLLIQGAEWEDQADGSGYDAYDLACMSGHDRIAHMLQHRKRLAREDAIQSAITDARARVKRERVWCDVCEVHYSTPSDERLFHSEHNKSISHQFCSMRNEVLQPQSSFYLTAHNKGYRMLRSHGWDETSGLGPTSSGRKYPIKTVLKRDRHGVGCRTSPPRVTHFAATDDRAVAPPKKKKMKTLNKRRDDLEKEAEVHFRRSFHLES